MVGDPRARAPSAICSATTSSRACRRALSRFLDFAPGPTGAVLVNNADWTRGVGYLEFLRDIGKYLTINYMMAKDSVRARLEGEAGISYTEFSYMLLQAFDFVHLAKAHGCRLQIGGSDQYGNITAGCELSRKMGGPQLFGLTAPLLLDSTGQKMGKTSTGERVWLDAERTPPYSFYQYFLNVTDEEASRLLKIFSLRSLEEIDGSCEGAPIEVSVAARARAADDVGASAEETARVGKRAGSCSAAASGGPERTLERRRWCPSSDRKPRRAALRSSSLTRTVAESRARGGSAAGGAYINNVRVTDGERKIDLADLVTPTLLVVRGGRKDYRLVRAADSAK